MPALHPFGTFTSAAAALVATSVCSAQSFDSGTTEGWKAVTMCYRPGFVANDAPIQLLPCCPDECPSTQNCIASVGCGNLACEPNNPSTFLEAPDVDGSCPGAGQVQYFSAPAALLASLAGAYQGSLMFDLQSTGSGSTFAQDDVMIDGAGMRLVHAIAAPGSRSWTSYSLPLAAGDWRITSPTGAPATAAQVQAVLAAAEALYIRAEFRLGPDTGFLDNVLAVPGPSCLADLDHNGLVNAADLAILLGAWGGAGGDLDGNGTTNAADLAVLLGAWGRC